MFLSAGTKRELQLRVEFYNVWNHTNWSFLNVAPTFDAAGNITNLAGTAGGGRYGPHRCRGRRAKTDPTAREVLLLNAHLKVGS
jgi:hypothetical protein